MRRGALLFSCLLLAACGGDGGAGSDEPAAGKARDGERSLTGCLKLWEGPHVGSTRMKFVAARQTIYAKVEVREGKCQVAFASKDGKVYGRYVEKPNVTGAWTKDAESAPVSTALKVVASANATGEPDGGLTPGAP